MKSLSHATFTFKPQSHWSLCPYAVVAQTGVRRMHAGDIIEFLLSLLFGLMWLFGSLLCGWLLLQLFAFVPLPGWLEMGIIIALSFWLGFMGIGTIFSKSTGASWAECREDAKGLLLLMLAPTGAACVIAVGCYLLINRFIADVELQKYVVTGVALAFWFTVVSLCTKHLARQNK